MRFKFEPYDNSRSTGTIAELMLQSGQINAEKLQALAQIAAQQQQQQGANTANLITNISNAGGNAVATMLAAREAEARRKQAQPLQDAQIANQRAQTAQAQQQTQQQGDVFDAQTEALKSDHIAKNVAYGMSIRDPQMREAVLQTFPPEVQSAATKYLTERYALEDADRVKRAKLAITMQYAPAAVKSLVAWDPDPRALDSFNKLTNNGQDQDAVIGYVNGAAQHEPDKPITLAKDATLVQRTPHVGAPDTYPVIASGQESPAPTPPNPTEWSVLMNAAKGDPEKAMALYRQQHPEKPDASNKLTYAAPTTMYVDGQATPVRAGSDGQIYGLDLKPIDADRISATVTHKPATGAEKQTLSYYLRAADAVKTITDKVEGGTSLEERIAKSGLIAQGQLAQPYNILQTGEQQRYRQAQRAFTEARLRKESGAAVPPEEIANDARTYFAQPGDDAETLKQKQHSRQLVIDGLKFNAGRAYNEYYGEDDDTTPARRKAPVDITQPGSIQVGPYTATKTPAKK